MWADCLGPCEWHDGQYQSAHQALLHNDWQSCIGMALADFPPALRISISYCFAISNPVLIYWGPDLVQIYNGHFLAAAATENHPGMMGQKWVESNRSSRVDWEAVHASLMDVLTTGKSVLSTQNRHFLTRGPLKDEEVYFDYQLNPIRDEDGHVQGIISTFSETTNVVLRRRQEKIFTTLRHADPQNRSVEKLFDAISKVANDEPEELPCVLYYYCSEPLVPAHTCTYSVVVSVGVNQDHVPDEIDNTEAIEWSQKPQEKETLKNYLLEALHIHKPVCVTDERVLATVCMRRAFGDRTRTLWLTPIFCHGQTVPVGIMVQGLNPRRPQTDNEIITRTARSITSCIETSNERESMQKRLKTKTAELAASRLRFETMAKASLTGIYILNRETEACEFVNDAYFELSGIPREAGIGRWRDYVHPDNKDTMLNVWDNVGGTPIRNRETRWITPWRDGLERWTCSSAIAQADETGTEYIFGALTDASAMRYALKIEKERADTAISTKQKQLEFLDMIAHELRNPLGAIMQSSDYLVEKLSGSRGPDGLFKLPVVNRDNIEDLQTITLCAQHMSRIINDTLNLSKLEGGMLIATRVPTHPLTVVKSLLAMFDAEAKRAGTSLEFEVDRSFHDMHVDWILTDPSRLAQIIINLLANSIKFVSRMATRRVKVVLAASNMPMKTRGSTGEGLSVMHGEASGNDSDCTRKDGEVPLYLVCRVSDTGPGMSEEQVSSLFQRYFQASPKTHVEYGGSGLGLFISKQLVALLNGNIDVESDLGKGTVFSFSIETTACEAPKLDVAAAAALPASETEEVESRKDTILIAEDNLINQKIMVKQLTNAGFLTLVADNGRLAIDMLLQDRKSSQRIALCLCDVEMPVLDGVATIREVRRLENTGELTDHCPFIAVTANARQEQIADILDAGMDDTMPKPFRFDALVTKMMQLLARLGRPALISRKRLLPLLDLSPLSPIEEQDSLRARMQKPDESEPVTCHRFIAGLWSNDTAIETEPFDVILLNTPTSRNIARRLWSMAGRQEASLRVCTDGATDRLHLELFECGVERLPANERPDVVLGDLDSITPKTRQFYEADKAVQVLRIEDQNSTDFTKAVKHIDTHNGSSSKDIVVLGGIGGRVDQTFSTLNTLFLRPRIYVLDSSNLVILLQPGSHRIDCTDLGTQCGLVPLTGATRCWSGGLEWCLNGESMELGGLISTNNRVVSRDSIVTVTCDSPVLFSIELQSSPTN